MNRNKLVAGVAAGLIVLGLGVWGTNNIQEQQHEERLTALKQEINDSLGPYADTFLHVSEEDNKIEISSIDVSSVNIDYPDFAKRVSEMSKASLQVLDANGEILGEIHISRDKISEDQDKRESISWFSTDGLIGNLHTSKGTDISDLHVKYDVSPDDLLKMYPESTPTPVPTVTPNPTQGPKPSQPLTLYQIEDHNDIKQYFVEEPHAFSDKSYDQVSSDMSFSEFIVRYPILGFNETDDFTGIISIISADKNKEYSFTYEDGALKTKAKGYISSKDIESIVHPTHESASSPEPTYYPKPDPSSNSVSESNESIDTSSTVYWTSSGEKYHSTPNCASLKRSKNVHSGTLSQAGNREPCKLCH